MRSLPFSVNHWFALPQSDYIENVVLSEEGSQSATVRVPPGAKYVMFSATSDFWMKEGSSVSVPNATTTDGTGAELNPYFRKLNDGVKQISVAAEEGCMIAMAFYW